MDFVALENTASTTQVTNQPKFSELDYNQIKTIDCSKQNVLTFLCYIGYQVQFHDDTKITNIPVEWVYKIRY